jgi:hypothetical protein
MTAIVMNTLTGAVSEYDWTFQSVTPTHAGDASGLYLLGGNLDGTQPIASSIETGKTLCGASVKKRVPMVYLSIRGAGTGLLRVFGEILNWSYAFAVRATGQSRAQPGKGIHENYLAFGFENVEGADFTLDRIEADISASQNRRVGS